jgi:hypothetical protein
MLETEVMSLIQQGALDQQSPFVKTAVGNLQTRKWRSPACRGRSRWTAPDEKKQPMSKSA